MSQHDIRWKQRLQNYRKALAQLDEGIELAKLRELSRLEKQGVIQAFEYTYELGWNTLKDFLQWQGIEGIVGSRDTIREAFSKSLIDDGQGWIDMLADRNRTTLTYNEATAEAILKNIRERYHSLFHELEATLVHRIDAEPPSGI